MRGFITYYHLPQPPRRAATSKGLHRLVCLLINCILIRIKWLVSILLRRRDWIDEMQMSEYVMNQKDNISWTGSYSLYSTLLSSSGTHHVCRGEDGEIDLWYQEYGDYCTLFVFGFGALFHRYGMLIIPLPHLLQSFSTTLSAWHSRILYFIARMCREGARVASMLTCWWCWNMWCGL